MSGIIQLDARLSLVFDLYDPCHLAADIGTDHAHLPAALLQRGRCQHMILTDISESALGNARQEIASRGLTDRVSFRCGDGLDPLKEKCAVISVTGMGGRTIRDLLLRGKDRLRGAALILSAHTDIPLIREAIRTLGYHLDREEPCFCAGRYYLVLRARPGAKEMTDREIRLGGPLFEAPSDRLIPYLIRRRDVLREQLSGLLSSSRPDPGRIARVREDIAFYEKQIGGAAYHDSAGLLSSDQSDRSL